MNDNDNPIAISRTSSSAVTTYAENGTGTVDSFNADRGPSRRYSIHGQDKDAFSINSSGRPPGLEGNLSFRSPPDFENPSDSNGDNVYMVGLFVRSAGTTGYTTVTVRVTDVNEPPDVPAAPTVSAKTGTIDSLDVSWSAPSNSGKPDTESYDLRYIRSDAEDKSDANWRDGPRQHTGTTATITSLSAGTSYDVQVRANNAEGESGWSDPGTGWTNAANVPPTFSDSETGIRSVPENTDAGVEIGSPVSAGDSDGDSLIYTLEGIDAASFEIVTSTGQLLSKAALDHETKDSYTVTVAVTDSKNALGNSDTTKDDSIDVSINVSNQEESGKITLSGEQPVVDSSLSATLTDPDGQVNSVTWQWDASSNQTEWDALSGATSASYTPLTSDFGQYLRATASYTDGHGSGKSAMAVSDNPVKTVPGAPAIGSVAPGDRALTLTWEAPSSNGGANIKAYDLRYIRSDSPDKSDDNWTLRLGIWSSGIQTYDLVGLENEIVYDVQIRAVSTIGAGAWSSSATETPFRPSSDATLRSLTLTNMDFGTFTPDTTSYTAAGRK